MCSAVETTTASKAFGLSKTFRRSLNVLAFGNRCDAASTASWFDVAEDDDVLVGMRCRRSAPRLPDEQPSRRDGELAEAREGASAAGDERDVQLVVQIPPAQQRRCASHHAGGQRTADKLAPRDATRGPFVLRLRRRVLHDVLLATLAREHSGCTSALYSPASARIVIPLPRKRQMWRFARGSATVTGQWAARPPDGALRGLR